MNMNSFFRQQVDGQKFCRDTTHNLLLFLKKLLRVGIENDHNPETMPAELVSCYNQLVLLVSNAISGLRLPSHMARSMLYEIHQTLNENKDAHPDLVNQLNAATNIYVALSNTEQSVNLIAKQAPTQPHAAENMLREINQALDTLSKTLQQKSAQLPAESATAAAITSIHNNIQSCKNHMLKKIYRLEQSPLSVAPTISPR